MSNNKLEDTIKRICNNIIKEVKQISKDSIMDSERRRVYSTLMKIAVDYYNSKEYTLDILVDVMYLNNNLYEIMLDSTDDYIRGFKYHPTNPEIYIKNNLNIVKNKSRLNNKTSL